MDYKIKIGCLISDNRGRILLIKERFSNSQLPFWNMITGTYGDNNPETIEEAAVRECREEVSLKVKLSGAVGCYIIKEGKKSIRTQFVFMAKIISGKPRLPERSEQVKRNEDIKEFKWFSRKEILKMKPNEFVAPRIYIILIDWIKNGKRYPLDIFKDVVVD